MKKEKTYGIYYIEKGYNIEYNTTITAQNKVVARKIFENYDNTEKKYKIIKILEV